MFTILFAFILLVIKWIISLFSKNAGRSFAEFIPIAIIAFAVIFIIYSIVASIVFSKDLSKFRGSTLPMKLFVIVTFIFLILGEVALHLKVSHVALEIVGCIVLAIIATIFIGLFYNQADENEINFFVAIPKFLVQELMFPIFLVLVILALIITVFQLIIVALSWILVIATVDPIILRFKDIFIVKLFSKS